MLGDLISAAAGIAGGLLGNKANEKAQRQQYEQQKEFAQSGIQWKVQDAEKAGIHPLYALGANTVSYAPQSVGGQDFSFLGNAGQNIGRAIDTTRSNPEKANALALTASQIQLEGMELDNDIKRATLASALATAKQGSNPGLPGTSTLPDLFGMPGQGDAPQVDPDNGLNLKKNISPASSGAKHLELAASPEVAMYKSKHGYSPQIPQSLSEPFEQDWPSFYQWYVRNKLFGDPKVMEQMPKKPGHRKAYSTLGGEYYYAKYPTFLRHEYKKWGPVRYR